MEELLAVLRSIGAVKLAWTLERQQEGHTIRWIYTLQAANEMGAPVPLPPEAEHLVRGCLRSGQLGTREPGSWILDSATGEVAHPQPRTGEGASAPGIIERRV